MQVTLIIGLKKYLIHNVEHNNTKVLLRARFGIVLVMNIISIVLMINKLGLSWAKFRHRWGLKLQLEVEV